MFNAVHNGEPGLSYAKTHSASWSRCVRVPMRECGALCDVAGGCTARTQQVYFAGERTPGHFHTGGGTFDWGTRTGYAAAWRSYR